MLPEQTAKVFVDNREFETLTIRADGSRVTIDGPYWFSEGLLLNNIYIGQVHYKQSHGPSAQPFRPVFHLMRLLPEQNKFVGHAMFESGMVGLEWMLL